MRATAERKNVDAVTAAHPPFQPGSRPEAPPGDLSVGGGAERPGAGPAQSGEVVPGWDAGLPPLLVRDEPAPEKDRLQSPEQRARFDDTTKCILCAACTTACPSFWADGEYVGPEAIVQALRFIFGRRDRAGEARLAGL